MSPAGSLQSFFRHLDELRSRAIKSLIAFAAASFVCFSFVDRILPWIIKPAGHLIFTSPAEGFSAYATLAMVTGFLISPPFILYQVWAFVGAALKPQERHFIKVFGPLSLLFFLLGVAFAFWVAIPMAYKFLMGFSSPILIPMVTVGNYLDFTANMVIAFGVTFELPLILAFLAKIGIATPEFLRQKRRHAIIIILIVAAILTPPDVASQVLLAIPLMVLYEVGIIFVKIAYKRKTL